LNRSDLLGTSDTMRLSVPFPNWIELRTYSILFSFIREGEVTYEWRTQVGQEADSASISSHSLVDVARIPYIIRFEYVSLAINK
jgi:hypothetical protein